MKNNTIIYIKRIYSIYRNEIIIILTFFFVSVTLSNVIHRIFGFYMLPFFEFSFDAFHNFCKALLNIFIFSWVLPITNIILYAAIYLSHLILNTALYFPDVRIPSWYSDVSLLSLSITRLFMSADIIVPRSERERAENQMPDGWRETMYAHEGRLCGRIHKLSDIITKIIWRSIETIHRTVGDISNSVRIEMYIRNLLIIVFGSVFLWGFIRMFGYALNISCCRSLESPIMSVRRRLFFYFSLNLIAAVIVAVAIFATSGWVGP